MATKETGFGKDLTEHWKIFFPERNGKTPDFKLNRNFTAETLNYASTSNIADQITELIVKRMRGKKFMIIECCAGIGGNTTSFLAHPQIYAVKAYERNAMRRLFLKRNIMAYDFGTKAIVPDIAEEGLSGEEDFSEYKEAVFYFDPPWLPEDFKGGKDYKNFYITKNMKVGKKTLEQWMARNKEIASLMVFRVPPKCVIEEVPGWTFEVLDFRNAGLIYFCYNNVIYGSNNGAKTTRKTVEKFTDLKVKDIPFNNEGGFGSLLPIQQECMRMKPEGSSPSCKVFLKYSFIDPEPVAEPDSVVLATPPIPTEPEKVQNKPVSEPPAWIMATSNAQAKTDSTIPVMPEPEETYAIADLGVADYGENALAPEGEDREYLINLFRKLRTPKSPPDSAQWTAEFQDYLFHLLRMIWPSQKGEEICKQMVGPEMMPIWIKAFTHETYDIDVRNNYENFETLGDKFVGAAFTLYTYNYFEGNINEQELTNYKNQYMQKLYQAEVSRFMKLGNWLRLSEDTKPTFKMFEDVFESFCGAMHIVGDLVKPGFGFVLVRKLVDLIFSKIKLDPRYGRDAPRTTVGQMFQGLGYADHFDEVALGDGRTFKIVLHDDLFRFLQRYFPALKTNVIADVKSSSKKAAKDLAWYNALIFLEGVGMTKKAVDEIKETNKLDFLETLNERLVKMVRSKFQKEGYTKTVFQNVGTASGVNSITALFIGIKTVSKPGVKEPVEIRETLGTGSGKDFNAARLAALQSYMNRL